MVGVWPEPNREQQQSCLQANVQVVGDTHNILPLQGVVRQALHWLMMQEGYHQALLLLHLYCSCKGALACISSHIALLVCSNMTGVMAMAELVLLLCPQKVAVRLARGVWYLQP